MVALDLSWMDTTDRAKGFREPKYFPALRFAVSKSNVWDKKKIYHAPRGFRWATLDEYNRYVGTSKLSICCARETKKGNKEEKQYENKTKETTEA